jgi:tripartite-type tricarboxylate transporter receptor subunit TctC
MTHIPYKGAAPALTDVMGGQIEVVASTIMSALPQLQSGRLKALAVTSAMRSSALPNVPTVAENALPGYEATAWSMVLAPARTPRTIVTRVSTDIAKFLQFADVRKKLAAEGAEPAGSTPEQAGGYLKAEIGRWAGVIKASGVQIE